MQSKVALASLAILVTQVCGIPYGSHGMHAPVDHPGIRDIDLLREAMTFEQFANAFYQRGLQNFTQADFDGLPESTRGIYEQISLHEQTYVETLTTLIGDHVPQPCTYDFGVTALSEFVILSAVTETAGTSGYVGAARFYKDLDLKQGIASIIGTKGGSAVLTESVIFSGPKPMISPFQAPLDLNQLATLFADFTVECPSDNPPRVAQVLPSLILNPNGAVSGSNITLTFKLPHNDHKHKTKTPLFATFINEVKSVSIPLHGSSPFEVTIPSSVELGISFVAITNSSERSDDAVTVAGPAFLILLE